MDHQPNLGRYDLRIRNSTYDRDNGNFECRKVEGGTGKKLHSSMVQLVVLLAPTPPRLEPVHPTVTEGKPFNLTCSSLGGSPPPEIFWYKNGEKTNLESLYLPAATSQINISAECPVGGHGSPDTITSGGDWTALESLMDYSEASEDIDLSRSLQESGTPALTTVAHITGGPPEMIYKAATITASLIERSLNKTSEPIEDGNVPVLQLDISNMSPSDLQETVNDLLRPLEPYIFEPRPISPSSRTSDRAESIPNTPPPSPQQTPTPNPSSSLNPSLSPIHTPISPTAPEMSRLTPIVPRPLPREDSARLEFRSSTAKTPLQNILEAINRDLETKEIVSDILHTFGTEETENQESEADQITNENKDGDTTMTTI